MPNLKFSQFQEKTDPANVQFVVGYNGTDNVRIAPGDIGGGATSLNGLSDCLADSTNNFIGNVPASASGATQNTSLGIDALNPITSGDFNVGVGYAAGSAVTTGQKNTAIGRAALANVSTNSGSTAVGYQAGFISTAGDSVYVGNEPGRANSATGHISIGYQAGYSQTSGTGNTNLGYKAGYATTTGASNVFIGYEAGQVNTGSNNIALGFGAAFSLTSGNDNTTLGHRSFLLNTTGSSNTIVGKSSGQSISTGSQNSFLGGFAGSNVSTGSNNTLIGYLSQSSSATVSNEITLGNASVTALRIPGLQSGASDGDVLTFASGTGLITLAAAGGGGASSLNGLTDCLVDTDSLYVGEVPSGLSGNPQANTILGIDAGASLTSGANNTLIGNDAGKGFTGGTAVFVGALAGEGTSTSNATGCIAMGWSALRAIQTGNDNIAIGFQAGRSIGNGAASNTMLGALAGFSNTASNTVMVGREAGRNNTATGSSFIGYQAGFSNTSGTENTNIGYQAGYSNTTGDRGVYIGYEAGYSNVGSDGVLIGYRAGYTVASSLNRSTMVGSYAGEAVGSARFGNTFMGYESGRYYNSNINTFFGNGTGRGDNSGASGALNTAIGGNCFQNSTTASKFVAIGYQCLANGVNTGSDIVAIGADIHASDNLTGSNNIVIGGSSSLSSTSVSNEITLGNSSITALRCAVTSITSISDERDKSDIKDITYGLAFIDALQPREFVWNNRAEIKTEIDKDGNETEVEFYSANKGKKDFGFIAQEVKELDNDTLRLVYDENPERLELSYGKLVPVLVQAIKELKAEIELLKQ